MSEQAIEERAPMQARPAANQAGSQAGHQAGRAGADQARGLLLIGLFKLAKSIFFFFVGLGALHLLHRDLGDEAMRIATALRFDPEGKVVGLLMEKIDLIDVHRLREIGFATFAYSALALTEGIGLMRGKVWAEYLTLGLTVLFLPWELFELVRHATWFRGGLLLINLAVLAYLLWLLDRKKATAVAVVD